MFKHLFRGLRLSVATGLLLNCRHVCAQLLRIEFAKGYVHAVRMARLSAIGLMGMGLVIGLICVGLLLIHAGLFILLPWTVKAKALVGMLLGLVYVAIGAAALRGAMSEKTWMEKSGAAGMLEEAIGPSRRC